MAGETEVWITISILVGLGLGGGLLIGYMWFNLQNRFWMYSKLFKKNYGLYFNSEKGGKVKSHRIDYSEEMPEVNGKHRDIPPESVRLWGGVPIAFGNDENGSANSWQQDVILDADRAGIVFEKEAERIEAEERAKKKNLAFWLQVGTLLILLVVGIMLLIQIGEIQKIAPSIITYMNQSKAVPVV